MHNNLTFDQANTITKISDPADTIQEHKSSQSQVNNWQLPLFIIITCMAIAVAGYFAYQYYHLKSKQITKPESLPLEVAEAEESETITPVVIEDDWKKGIYGEFIFKYPQGWNIAFYTPEVTDETQILLSPFPITVGSTGKLATFILRIIGTPDVKVSEDYQNGYYENVKKEILDSSFGPISYYYGTVAGEYLHGMVAEQYSFEMHPADSQYSQLFVGNYMKAPAGDTTTEDYSEIFKEVILSFERVD